MIAAVVSGRVSKDARVNNAGGTPVCSFDIASSAFRNKEKVTDWVSVSFWGERGTKVVQYLTKGTNVTVRGTLHIREYQKNNGEKGWALELRADDIDLQGGGQRADERAGDTGEIPF